MEGGREGKQTDGRSEREREGGREQQTDGGREGGREGITDRWREGGNNRRREGGREGGNNRQMEGGREFVYIHPEIGAPKTLFPQVSRLERFHCIAVELLH